MLTIHDLFLFGIFVLVLGCGAAFIFKVKPFQILFWSVFYVYIIVVLGLTVFPIPYQGAEIFESVPNNFIPFKTIMSTLQMGLTVTAFLQIAGNVLIAAPYGVVLGITMRKSSKIWLLLLPLLFPLVIELLQFIIGTAIGYNYRSVDIDDFILNALGAYLGILFSKLFLKNYGDMIYGRLFVHTKK